MEAYPLHWPVGYPRTKNPKKSRFGQISIAKVRNFVLAELYRLKAKDVIISSNIPLRQDGLPYSDFSRRNITDKGVAVYFTKNGHSYVLCCDTWEKFEDNFQAIGKTIEAMRGLDRWGVSDMLKRVFTGFTALPEPKKLSIWEILGLTERPNNFQAVRAAYYKRCNELHPDKGGSHDEMVELNIAYNEAALTFSI